MIKKAEDLEALIEREELFQEMILRGAFSFEEKRRDEEGNFRHTLPEVLLVWLAAMLCGIRGYRDMEWFANLKIDFLRRFYPYTYGPPSKSTILRVIALINPAAMNDLLLEVVANIERTAPAKIAEKHQLPTIALDGKTSCGLQVAGTDQSKLHVVSAFDTTAGITLMQEAVPDRSNEIVAIKSLLSKLDIEGKTITIDAIGTQREITGIICQNKGDYILAVKDNQLSLHQAIKSFFADRKNCDELTCHETYDKGHGRIERRTCYASSKAAAWFKGEGWFNLNTIVMVEAERTIADKSAASTRYFISSLPPDAETLSHAIRSHWSIESMHWSLDVTFNEDSRISWHKTVTHNETIARRIVMNMIKGLRDKYKTRSKTEKATYNLLQKVLFADDNTLELLLRGAFK